LTTNKMSEINIEFRIDHVGVSVCNLGRSILFYERNLGFSCERVIELPGRNMKVALLRRAGFTIEMFEFIDALPLPEDRKSPNTDLRTVGVKHFALNTNDILAASDFLKRNGVEFISEVTVGVRGLRRFFIKDPDGIGIEVTESAVPPEKV
jgi:methylmalonyl-CoA/ethylmalonyl-CoA epimerase